MKNPIQLPAYVTQKITLGWMLVLLMACSQSDSNESKKNESDHEILVVNSIKPLHLITKQLLDGVGKSEYIIKSQDVHGFQLSPSHIKLMRKAQFVVGVGEGFEGNVSAVFDENDFVFESYQSKLNLLEMREGLRWDDHDHGDHESVHANEEHDEHDEHKIIDKHFWLSSENSKAFAQALAIELQKQFPNHKEQIQNNLVLFVDELSLVEKAFSEFLTTSNNPAFMVFHDGFHYLTNQYQFNEVAAVVSNPSQSTGIKSILELKELAVEQSVVCIFVEPGFNQSLITTLNEVLYNDTKRELKVLTWDVLGLNANNYSQLIENIYLSYKQCH